MNRRRFVQQGSLASLALGAIPHAWASSEHNFALQEKFTVEELMGQAAIDLYGEGIDLRKEAYECFVKMKKAAYQDGIDIKVVSSYRSYERQRAIFERKYIRYTDDQGLEPLEAIDKIIEYSTIPGTSRHHWGTDVDLIDASKPTEGDVLVAEKFGPGGPFEDFKRWMDENSEEYGFYLVYTDNPKRRGFKYEPWHYSYAPLSIPMLAEMRMINLIRIMEKEDFYGSEYLTRGFLRSYIADHMLDINPDLL